MQQLFRHVLVPLDQSKLAETALEHAAALALAFGARVSLLRVIEPDCVGGDVQPTDPLQGALRQAHAGAYLARVAESLRGRGLTVDWAVSAGDPAQQVVSHLRHQGADLLVLCSHGQRGSNLCTLGGHALEMVLQARVSVLLARPPLPGVAPARSGPILVPLDGSPRAEHALPVARIIAQAGHAALLLAHVLPPAEVPRHVPLTPAEQRLVHDLTDLNRAVMAHYLDDAVRRVAAGGEVQTRLLDSRHPVEALHDLIVQADVRLVVMSAHGYSGLRRWPFGSAALNLLIYAGVPVLIVQDLNPLEIGAEAPPPGDQPVGH